MRLLLTSATTFCGLIAAISVSDAAAVRSGKDLLATHCARCHAIGKADDSPLPKAPPLRNIYRQYPIERLEFELSEGIGSKHPAMPQIQFSTEQIDKILEYLEMVSNPKK